MFLLNFIEIFLILILSLYLYFTRNFNYWKKLNVVGPLPVVFFGNLKESTLRRKNIGVVFKELYDSYPDQKIIGIYRMTTPCLLIRDLDIIKHVMVKDFDFFADRGFDLGKDSLGANLFHADADLWKVLRTKFSPLFTSAKLKQMIYLMAERGDIFLEHINTLCEIDPEQDIHELVKKYTIGTIFSCAFGIDIDTINDKLKILEKVDKLIFTPNFFLELDMMYPGILKKINGDVFPAFIRKFFMQLVQDITTQRNGLPSSRRDFMDFILEMKQEREIVGVKRRNGEKLIVNVTEDIIAAQAFVFYVAGYETSATTMSYMLYRLALNPNIQHNVQMELDEVLSKYKGRLTHESLKELIYLDQVFKETLRMHPLAEPLLRSAKMDYKIPGTKVIVKKGQTILISPMGIHYDEKYYPNPNEFDPDRFAPEKVANRHPCAFLPFGVGPRNCIGMRFAKLQSFVCIAMLLSKFHVEPSKNTPFVLEIDPKRIIIGPKQKICLNLIKRI